jgi:Flp pilus assembly protein TadG
MTREIKSFVRRLHKDDSGAVIVLVAVAIVALLGVTALAIDLANLVYAQRRLQATTDMAAQAGAVDLNCNPNNATGYCVTPTTQALTTARNYSAASGELNAQPNLNVAMVSGYPKLYCLQSTGIYYSSSTETCSSATSGANAIEVQQQATVPLIFGNLLGPLSTVTLAATSLASAKSNSLPPLNIVLVIDNTGSMNNKDPTSPAPTDCGVTNPTRIECALAGAQALISELWPTQDEVGMMVFPPMTAASALDDATCNGSNPTLQPYGAGTYQVLTFAQSCPSPGAATCYKTSNTATTLNLSSLLGKALCQSGMTTPAATCGTCKGDKVVGGEGTYLGGAIQSAQNYLNANPGVSNAQNVMIVLSDGGAGNASSYGAPASNECNLSVTKAQNAANAGTWVYSIAYGSNTSPSPNANGCSDTETSPTANISACQTMAGIASDPTKFYSDPMGAGGSNVFVHTYSGQTTPQVTPIPTSAQTCVVGGHTFFCPPGSNAKVLNFASGFDSTYPVQAGMGVQDVTPGHTTYIPVGTTVATGGVTGTTVTLTHAVTNTIPSGDEIQFAYSFAGSTVLYFPSVPSTVKVGMGVADNTYSTVILPGTTVASINTTANTVTINAGEGGIVTNSSGTDGVQPGDQIVFSPVGNCTSQDNPTPTDLVSIFQAIAASLTYTQLLPVTCISSGANTC